MATIKVISAIQALEAAQKNPAAVLAIKKKTAKAGAKKYQVEYFDLRWTAGPVIDGEGWFLVENLTLRGMAAPGDSKDQRTTFESTRMRLETRLSKAGPFGQFLMMMNAEWIKKVKDMIAAGDMIEDGQKTHDLLRITLSKKNAENPGGLLEDPTISFQIDFRPFSATYPVKALRGLPKTQFFDASKEFADPTNAAGPKQYAAATVTDAAGNEIPVDASNIHQFVTHGSILRKGRIHIPSAVISAKYISAPISIQYALIEPSTGDGGFEDPEENEQHQSGATVGPIPPADAGDIAAAIGDL